MLLWRCSWWCSGSSHQRSCCMLPLVGVGPQAPGSKDCSAALVQQQLLPTPTATLQAVFCSSKLIDALITFGAQNYLEFKLMQGRQASPGAACWDAAVTFWVLHAWHGWASA